MSQVVLLILSSLLHVTSSAYTREHFKVAEGADTNHSQVAVCALYEELSTMEPQELVADQRFIDLLTSIRPLRHWTLCDEYYSSRDAYQSSVWKEGQQQQLQRGIMTELAVAVLVLANSVLPSPQSGEPMRYSYKDLYGSLLADESNAPLFAYEWAWPGTVPAYEWRASMRQTTDFSIDSTVYKLEWQAHWVAWSLYLRCQQLDKGKITLEEFVNDARLILSSVMGPIDDQ